MKIWSPQARDDLLDIYRYVATDNPSAARALHNRIVSRVVSLSVRLRGSDDPVVWQGPASLLLRRLPTLYRIVFVAKCCKSSVFIMRIRVGLSLLTEQSEQSDT